MVIFILTFAFSVTYVGLIIKFFKNTKFGSDNLVKPQKFHVGVTPRIGGLGIFLSLFSVALLMKVFDIRDENLNQYAVLLGCSLFCFVAGFVEDVTNAVSPLLRLTASFSSALLAIYLLDSQVLTVGFEWGDRLLSITPLAIIFTVVVVGALVNSINIIDGFNGLSSMVAIIMFSSMAYVSWRIGDQLLFITCLSCIGAIAGFFVWNFPKGYIFLGDGGAYFVGFLLAECAILLVKRNPNVSPWYVALLFIYPVFETIFSIYRRKIVRGIPSSLPDGIHMHTLIYRRLLRWAVGSIDVAHITLRNSMTAPYLWLLCGLAVLPATIWWQNTSVLMVFVTLFCISYVWLYISIVRFKTPKWLVWRRALV